MDSASVSSSPEKRLRDSSADGDQSVKRTRTPDGHALVGTPGSARNDGPHGHSFGRQNSGHRKGLGKGLPPGGKGGKPRGLRDLSQMVPPPVQVLNDFVFKLNWSH